MVDSLFVSKFPMRKQVYSFTEKLLELGMAYKPVEVKGGREGDAIRDMRKQLPALNNSAKVGSIQRLSQTICRTRAAPFYASGSVTLSVSFPY